MQLKRNKLILTPGGLTSFICWTCAFLFLYAAFYKLMDYRLFKRSLELSPVIGNYGALLSLVLPAVELAVAGMLFYVRFRKPGLIAFIFIMSGFSVYIFYILNFSPTIPCSCGGVLQRLGWWEHLVFNLAFILLAILGLQLMKKRVKAGF